MATRKPKEPAQNKAITPFDASGNLVTMSNALIRSGQCLTLAEKRLVMLAVSKLNPKTKPTNPAECITRVSIEEFVSEYGIDQDNAYNQVKSAAKHLYSRSITFFEPSYRRKGAELVPIEVNMRWVGKAKYHKGEGWIELHWWHEIVPHLMGLKRQFTTYQLEQANSLRSIYSWRLLELLMRFQDNGWAEYNIEDFCTSMEATPKQRQNFAAIRRKIIEPAVKELTEKDGWIIEWKPINAGRKVKAIRFEFERDPQQRLL